MQSHTVHTDYSCPEQQEVADPENADRRESQDGSLHFVLQNFETAAGVEPASYATPFRRSTGVPLAASGATSTPVQFHRPEHDSKTGAGCQALFLQLNIESRSVEAVLTAAQSSDSEKFRKLFRPHSARVFVQRVRRIDSSCAEFLCCFYQSKIQRQAVSLPTKFSVQTYGVCLKISSLVVGYPKLSCSDIHAVAEQSQNRPLTTVFEFANFLMSFSSEN